MALFQKGRRGAGLPRNRPSPEHNIVQNAAVARGVQRFAGTRQAHVMPALAEGLGAYFLAGDVREDPRTGLPESYAAFHEVVPDGVNVKRAVFGNPIDSAKIAVLRRYHAYQAEDFALAAGGPFTIVYDKVPLGATAFEPFVRGQRLVSGYTQMGGITPPVPPGTDIVFPLQNAACGWKTTDVNGIAGGYFWRGIIGGIAGHEVLEDFNPYSGPRFIIYPGGTFETYLLETSAHMYFNMWWDEYPLS